MCWLWLSGVVIVLDQASKLLAEQALPYAEAHRLLPVLDLTLLYNRGAAFSFLAGAGGWQRWVFIGIALAVSLFLLNWMRRTPRQHWCVAASLALLLGGALGNLFDRIVYGHVIDFISVHYAGWYFPAFNLADSAITLGAILLIYDMLFISGRKPR